MPFMWKVVCELMGSFVVIDFARIKNLALTRQNFIEPLSEKTFYNPRDKKDYLKIAFLTENSGLILRSTEKDGKYIEDYYSDPFIKRGNTIVAQDEDFPREYEMADWYLKNITKGYSYKEIFQMPIILKRIVKQVRLHLWNIGLLIQGMFICLTREKRMN